MSDQTEVSPVVANATQALAMKEMGGRIDALKKQITVLWVTVAIIGVIAIVGAGFTVAGRLFGSRLGGGFAGRGGTFNGQQFNGGTGGTGTQQAPQTTPAQ
jgi:hypothetical protein